MANNNVISFEHSAEQAQKRLRGQHVQRVIKGVRVRIDQTLPHLMQELFESLDDEFYTLSDRSASDELQTRYFDAMRQIRRTRQSIEQGFLREFSMQLDRFWEHPRDYLAAAEIPSASEVEGTDMSLLEEDDLEESLAISNMVSKASNRFHQTLYALNKRLAFVAGLEEIQTSVSPLGPKTFAEAFAKGLAAWDGETITRLVVYKLFERHVVAYLGGLYDDINDVLVENDILPKISRRIQRSPVAPSVRRARDPEGQVGGDAPGNPSLDDTLLRQLASLVAERRREEQQGSSPHWYDRSAASVHLPQVSTRELIGALGSVQQVSLNQAPIDIDSLREMQAELMDSLGRELDVGSLEKPIKRLGDNDRNLLDVMGMLFDFILDDDNLPESMKALLGRLQIPLLKVGLEDRRFFNDREHPARKLLNTLARSALAWTDDGDRSRNSTFGQIEAAVMRVLTDFDRNVNVFEEVNAHFDAYLEREQRTASVAEKRLVQARDGQESLQQAKLKVSQQIADFIRECESSECHIPEVVDQILTTGWRDVMLLILLREGEKSEAWKHASELARKLIWSVQPKREAAERQRLLKAIPDLLKDLREGLNDISYDQHSASVMLKELQACHIAALRGAPGGPPSQKRPVVEVEAAATPVKEEAEQKVVVNEPEDEFHKTAKGMAIGGWMEWTGEAGQRIRGKLSWRSEISGSCVFVDRRGMKLAEMTLDEISELLRSAHARTIDDVDSPLMDKALDAMMDALRRTAPENRNN